MAASCSFNATRKSQKKSTLNKKYPANPRYRHVKPIVDSGDSIRKYVENIEDHHRHCKLGKDEVFRRIRLESLVQLIIEVGYNALREDKQVIGNGDSLESCLQSPVNSILGPTGDGQLHSPKQHEDGVMTSRSTLHSVINGIGEMDLTANLEGQQRINYSTDIADIPKPYLLLDVRDRDSYNENHVISAVNYPYTMTSRSVNYETKDLLAFILKKNIRGTVIVIYDDDETFSQKVATTLVQRGYENVYLLSGGLKLAQQKFNEDLVVTQPGQMKREFTVHGLKDYNKTARMSLRMETTTEHRDLRRQADDQTRAPSVSSISSLKKPWK